MHRLIHFMLVFGCVCLAACAQQGPTEAPTSTLPFLLLHGLATQEAGTLHQINPTSGQVSNVYLRRVSEAAAVMEQPHLPFAGALIGEDGAAFSLPAGWSSPDGRWLAYCTEGSLAVRLLNQAQPHLRIEGCNRLLWSPDSRFLAFTDPQGLHIAEIEPATTQNLTSGEDVEPLAWSPDGRTLLYRSNGDVLRQGLDERSPQQVNLDGNRLHGEVYWPGSGQTIYARYGGNNWVRRLDGQQGPTLASIVAVDLENGRQRQLVDSGNLDGALAFAPSPSGETVAVWYATCRRVLNQLMPIPELECSAELRFVETATQEWTVAGEPIVARRQSIPEIAWAAWQAPAVLPANPETTTGESTLMATAPLDDAEGTNSERPVPFGESGSGDGKTYRILDVRRGANATALLNDAVVSTQILPLSPGYEHVAVNLEIDRANGGSIYLGGRSIPRLFDGNGASVPPLLLIDGESGRQQLSINASGNVSVWLPFLVATGGDPLLLALPGETATDQTIFLALGEAGGPSQAVSTRRQTPNAMGLVDPAGAGETVIATEWQMRVRTVLHGDAVAATRWLAQALPAALFDRRTGNGPIVAALLEFQYQGEERFHCQELDLTALAPARRVQISLDLAPGFPTDRQRCVLPGGRFEAWIFLESGSDDDSPVLIFTPSSADPLGARYFALTATEPPQEESVVASIGASRAAPYPFGEAIETSDLSYQIREVIRGAAAAEQVAAALSANQPAPQGREHVLIELAVQNDSAAQQALNISTFALTGDRHVLYRPAFLGLRPSLPPQLAPGESATGWLAFEAADDETNLVLMVNLPFDLDLRWASFLAAVPGAAVRPPADLATVAPNDAGRAQTDPAALAESVVTERWQLTILEAVRGAEAWAMVQEANANNSAAPAGFEYMLIRVRIRLLEGSGDDLRYVTPAFLFNLVDGRGATPRVTVVPPSPRLGAELFPGGEKEGWLVHLAPVGQPVWLQFQDPDQSEDIRTFSIP